MKTSRLFTLLLLNLLIIAAGCTSKTIPVINSKSETGTHSLYSFNELCSQINSIEDKVNDSSIAVDKVWRTLNNHYKNNKNRKLVVFMDGTSNTKSSHTNIWQLYKLSLQQACSDNPVIPYYIKGLGTDWYDAAGGNVSGAGTDIKIQKAYHFLTQTYQKHDQIYLFGFSRGAFTVRSLNGMLNYVGLLSREKPISYQTIKKLYKAYNQHHDGTPLFLEHLINNISQIKNKLAINTIDVIVSAIGVFDTVPALGEKTNIDPRGATSGTILFNNPSDHRTDLYAKRGFHALSLDEQRTAFKLFRFHNLVNDGKQHILEEVWFPGAHKNIGGDKISNGLSKIPLHWMINKFTNDHIFPENIANFSCQALKQPCEGAKRLDMFLDNKNLWEKGRVYKRWPRDHDLVHESVFCRKEMAVLPFPHKELEPDGKYHTLNLKSEQNYQIVPYQCSQSSTL